MAPKRFTNGIATVSSSNPLGALEIADPTKWTVYFEDFVGPLFNTASITNTTVTENGLSITSSTNAVVALTTDAGAANGALSIGNGGANDNESGLIQTISPGWILTSGKKFVMETSFEITAANVDDVELFIGLGTSQTGANFFATNGTARTFDDGIGWYTTDGDTDIDVICGENDVFDNVTVKATYVTATWYRMSIYYDGTDITCYVDDVAVAKLTPSAIPISVTGPTIYFKSGAGEAQAFLCDYLLIAKER